MKKQTKKEAIQQLYGKLLMVGEIPVIERVDIHSKGLYLTEPGKKEIYIKQSLPTQEKLKVLLHEYSHYIHLTHYYRDESRAECEIIANGAAYLICMEYGLNIYKDVELSKFSENTDTVTRLTATIETVAGHILAGLNQVRKETPMYSDRTIKVELEDYLLYDKLNILAIEYSTAVDRLVNVAVRRLVSDVEFFRELRKDRVTTAHHQGEQT